MVYQGVVMEVEKNCIIVLTDDTNYVKLKQKGNIDIGKKIMFIEDDIIKKSNRSFKPLIAIAAAIILAIATIIGQFGIDSMKNFQAYAIVSLDINPSLEFQIDEQEIVKKIHFLNKDSREIIYDNMVGMQIEDVIILSIKEAINKQYLNNEENVVLVSDMILDDNAEVTTVIKNEIFERVTEDKELQGIELIYVNSDKEDFEKAKENQISIGKYKIYKIISSHKPDVKLEDIKDKTVSVIVEENKGLTKGKKVKTYEEEKQEEEEKIEEEEKNKEVQIKKQNKNKENGNNGAKKGNSKNKENNSSKKDKKEKKNKNIEDKEYEDENDDDDDDEDDENDDDEDDENDDDEDDENDDDDDDEDDDEDDDDDDEDDDDDDENSNKNSKKNMKENKSYKNKNKKDKKNNSKKNAKEDDDDD